MFVDSIVFKNTSTKYRPHQARETLKVMMALQKKNLTDVGDKLVENMEQAATTMKKCAEEMNKLVSFNKLLNRLQFQSYTP